MSGLFSSTDKITARAALMHRVLPRSQARNRGGVAALAPALALLALSAVAIVLAGFSPTGAGGQYAVIAPPWYDLGQTVQLAGAAGSDVVDVGGFANVVIVYAKDPKIVRALYGAGAWLVLDPGRVRGCLGFAAPSAALPGVS